MAADESSRDAGRRERARRVIDGQMHPDVAMLHQAIQSAEDRLVDLRSAVETMSDRSAPDQMRSVIVGALREAAADPAITRVIYDAMSRHAQSSLAEYIGRRVIVAFVTLVVTIVLSWNWAAGHLK